MTKSQLAPEVEDGKEVLAPLWKRAFRLLGPFILHRWSLLVVAAVALLAGSAIELLKPWPMKLVVDFLVADQLYANKGGSKAPPGAQPADTLPEGVLPPVSAAGEGAAAIGVPVERPAHLLPEWAIPTGIEPALWLLGLICALVLVTAFLSSMAAYFKEFALKRIGEEVSFELRVALFRHVQGLGLSFHDNSRLGDIITRITDDTRAVRELATTNMLEVCTAIVILVAMLGLMFVMDWQLAMVALINIPILGPTVWFFKGRIEKASKQRRKSEGELTSVTQETMTSIRLVKAMGREDHQQKSFGKQSGKSAEIGLRVARLEASYARGVEFISALGTCAVIWFGVHRVWAGSLSPGDLLVFAAYVHKMYAPMRDLAKQSGKISKGKAGLERVIEVLELEPTVTESEDARVAPPFAGRVEFQGVGFAYKPGLQTLEDISFTAEPGEVIALVGHSGSGKSTIISLISRLYDPTAGRILIDGHDIRDFTLDSLRDQVSVVMQESVLLQTSITENILYGRQDATPAEVEAACQAAAVSLFVDRLANGYDTVVGPRGATLSGGERQRVAIARAIVRGAPILLLDEPTTGLDAQSERLVMEGLARLMEGKTTLLVSHKLSLIERADKLLVIDAGRIVECGTHRELLARGGTYARLYEAASLSGELADAPASALASRPRR